MNKYLNKVASLLKNKRLVGKINPKGFRFKGKNGPDTDAFNKLLSLHETVERQVTNGTPPVKHRLTLGDGSKAFIRGNSKGVRSRLYRE